MNWDLTILYKSFDDPAFTQDWKSVNDMLDVLLSQVGTWSENADVETHENILRSILDITNKASDLESYVELTLAVDTSNAAALSYMANCQDLSVKYTQFMNEYRRFLGKIPQLDTLLSKSTLLNEHAFFLQENITLSHRLLSPEVESVIAQLRVNGSKAFALLHNMIDGEIVVEYRGENIPLSAARNLAYNSDPTIRKDAFEAELACYSRYETTLAACLNSIKGDAITSAKLRDYDSALDMILQQTRMDRETLDALLCAMEESLPHFRRYMKAKAEYLGYDPGQGLPFYDLFAPVGNLDSQYSLEQAHELLCKNFSRYNPEIAAVIDRAFRERWIDAYPRAGKQGGAFCHDLVSKGVSRIMTNYDGDYSSISTLAHELGHAFHGDCLVGQTILNTDVPMPLAETASTFNELVIDSAMMEGADDTTKFSILEQSLTGANQVITDILSRFYFECSLVDERQTTMLSASRLCQLMTDAQKRSYGDGLNQQFLHPYMWACKPHYYMSDLHFYNFPYAFGLLFATGLFAKFLEKGESFHAEYRQLLADSGKDTIANVAAKAGVDVRDIEFWRSSLSIIREKIDTFCLLAKTLK